MYKFHMLQDQNIGSKMKMLLSMVLLFSSFCFTGPCPENCFCELYKAECHLTECITEVDFLIVYGSLCDNHKYILKNIQNGAQVLLKDNECEDIQNCR